MLARRSLTITNLFVSLISIIILITVMGSYWIRQEYKNFETYRQTFEKEYLEKQRQDIKREIDHVFGYLEFKYNRFKYDPENEKSARKEALDYISTVSFPKNGYIFVQKKDSTFLIHPKKHFIGKTVSEVNIMKAEEIFNKLMAAASSPEGGFLEYNFKKPGTDEYVKKISYSRMFSQWGWLLATGIFVDDIETELLKKADAHKMIIRKHITFFVALLIGLLCLSSIIVFGFSLVIKKELTMLTHSFQKTALSYEKIDTSALKFSEFINTARYANQMVDIFLSARNDLKESESLYRSLFERAMEGLLKSSLEGKMIMMNPSMARILGYDSVSVAMAELTDLSTQVYAAPDERKKILKALSEEGRLINHELKVRRKDGSIINVLANYLLIHDENGKPTCIEGSCIDITERVQAERSLQEREQQLSVIINNIPGRISRIDHDYKFVFVNKEYERVYGLPPEKMIGRTFSEIYGEDVFQKWRPYIDSALNGESFSVEIDFRDKDGELHYGLTRFVPDEKPDGTVAGLFVMVTDITEMKKSQKQQRMLEEQLAQSQKIEALGRLAGGVAHDFNNMLNVILGYTEMTLDMLSPEHPLYENLTEIHNAGKRSSDITRQLLAFARKQTISPTLIDLNETIGNMLKMLQRLIGENIEMTWTPSDNLWKTIADGPQIEQVLTNLLVNASDAIGGSGKIFIKTENITIDDTYCSSHLEYLPGDFVLLTVSDTGSGMEKEELDQIFDPFYTTKSMGKGTGLGLATVYGIVKQNGGFINVYSEPGKGSVFKIYLPRHMGKDETPTATIYKEKQLRGEETILLVEDEGAILKLAKNMLEKMGYHVISSTSPSTAIDMAANSAEIIHLLITDVIMPEINGRDLYDSIKKIHPGIQCIYMSGYTANIIEEHGVLDGNVHFIHKPFSRKELGAKVFEALKKGDALKASDNPLYSKN